MLPFLLLAIAVCVAAWLSVARWRLRRRDREAWNALAARYPTSDAPFEGQRFAYSTGGQAIIGASGFRAQPDELLSAIEVEWSQVRAVRSGLQGGVEVHVSGGVVVVPGAASAAIAEAIGARARRRQLA